MCNPAFEGGLSYVLCICCSDEYLSATSMVLGFGRAGLMRKDNVQLEQCM
jgi:hypothetical protein